jgi:hypothetical protein
VAAAIATGELRNANPDLLALYCWSVAHGVMTIALACRLDACAGMSTRVPTEPLEVFRSFRSFVRDGIAAASDVPVGVAGDRKESEL